MMTLDPGNILLKPSHRRQLTTWLRRALHLGQRLKQFALKLTMFRRGRLYEVTATVHSAKGDVVFRSRRHDWQTAVRDLARTLAVHLRDQRRTLAM